MLRKQFRTILAVLAAGIAAPALADINVGVSVSATGPAASLGIPEKNTFELLPTTIAWMSPTGRHASLVDARS